MYNEWSLDVLYKGADDPKLASDLSSLEEAIESFKALPDSFKNERAREAIKEALLIREKITLLSRRISGFFSLRRSTDSKDAEGAKYMTKIQGLFASMTVASVAFDKFVGSLENLDEVIEGDELLTEYSFLLHEIKEEAKHNLSDEAENVFARMNISGGRAWGDLMSHLTASVEVDYKGTKTSLSAIRGLAESADKEERRAAYEAEIACYDKIKDAVAFSLNSIKAQVNTEAELRGYENPLAMTLKQSRMEKATLDAMLEAMREAMPKFREYLRHKARLLGYKDGLPWYEIYAPMGNAPDKTYTAEDAHKFLVERFSEFAPDLAEMIDTAFKEEWIDFFPRQGKAGGAFCSNLPFIGQSRILTNFSGSFGSIVTLAHELGHAYHGKQIESHRPLNTGYSMPVAETASTFNELVVMESAIKAASGEEKIRLIESQLQDLTQIIVDIYSRFLFEDEVIRRRKLTFMFPDELCEIMLNAQREAFGDGLEEKTLHPYMWCCKGHYYRAGLSYYNFPYAFGGLFARGLYAKYKEEGEAFLPKYRALLKATTVDTVENVARVAGIDLTNPDFWRKSLTTITEQIDLFIKETSV